MTSTKKPIAFVQIGLPLLAFLASGAWMVYSIPGEPIAQGFFALTAAVWAGVVGFGFAPMNPLSKRMSGLLVALVVCGVISTAANPYFAQAFLYDIYGGMPLVFWCCYPLMFFLAAGFALNKELVKGLRLVFFVAAFLAVFAFIWRWSQGFVTVFGSPAYATPALAPVIVLGCALAKVDSKKRQSLYYALVVVFTAALLYATAGLLAMATLFFSLLLILFISPQLLSIPGRLTKATRVVGGAGASLTALAAVLVQFPFVNKLFFPLDKVSAMGQTIATRIFLWDGAQKMFLQKPFLGYGSAGYRINAVGFYDSRVFSFLSNLGDDPTVFSSPSPHSILWDALLRLGLIGTAVLVALFIVWALEVRSRLKSDDSKAALVRSALAIGFCTYLFSLLFTPVHFASGLFGVVMGGLALAPSVSDGAETKRRVGTIGRIVLCIAAVALAGFGIWRMIGLSAAQVDPNLTLEENYAKAQGASKIVPGYPLNERHLLEGAIALSETDEELKQAQEAIDQAPGYITSYGPNFALFARYSLNDAEITGRSDLSWESEALKRAANGYPDYSLLTQELEHLRALEDSQPGEQ